MTRLGSIFLRVWPLLTTVLVISSPFASAADPKGDTPKAKLAKLDAEAVEFFEKKIRPVLVTQCYECHSAKAKELQGGLALDTRQATLKGGESGPAVVPKNIEKSLLIKSILYGDEFSQMPPKGKLPANVIADFMAWIKIGAPDPRDGKAPIAKKEKKPLDLAEARKFWAFQPPGEAKPPVVKNETWVRQPLDRFILAALEAKEITPTAAVDKRTFIRRATYDLTGLPPTPQEIDSFLTDRSPKAHATLIDRLLSSPRYGERWGRHWLDVVRYADSNGLDENLAYSYAYRYRDYVIESFNTDKPYDRFVQEQLAGDLLGTPNESEQARNARLIATGFLSLGPKMLACDDGRKMEMDIIDEQVDTTSRAFMGLTMGCARCHDHKFDPLPTKDYYALAGIFKSTKTMENFNVVARWHEHELVSDDVRKKIAEFDTRIKQLDARLKTSTQTAQKTFLNVERAKAGAYLTVASQFVRFDLPATLVANSQKTLAAKMVLGQKPSVAGTILIEAEKYTRGNAKKVGPIIQNGGNGDFPNEVEYDITIPNDGSYRIEFLYTSGAKRPMRLLINEQFVRDDALTGVTGGFANNQVKWFADAIVTLKKGRITLRLEQPGPIPHIDKLAIIPTNEPTTVVLVPHPTPKQSTKKLAADAKLNVELLKQWIGYLRGVAKGPDTIWQAWAKSEANQHTAQAAAFAKRFNEAYQAWTTLQENDPQAKQLADVATERFRAVLFDAKGPFRLPKKPERFYTKPNRDALASLTKEKAALEKQRPVVPRAMGVREGTITDLKVHERGNYLTLGEDASRHFPIVIAGEKQAPLGKTTSGRLELAKWIANPAHPLTARVMANRIWLWHFGEGIVRSPDNFGLLGQRPTNQPLLDWLARKFIETGWSVKDMHRTIMLSAAYRMGTDFDANSDAKDPENLLYWRFRRRRLSAEEVRDSILAMGGALDFKMYGQLMPDKNRAYVTGTGSKQGNYDFPRRSVYLPILRSAVYPMLQAFDFPDPAVLNGKRATTTVAPQALFLMNDGLVLRETRRMAEKMLQDKKLDDAGRIRTTYQRVYGRAATNDEVTRNLDFIARYADALQEEGVADANDRRVRSWQGLCRVLLAANEFIYID
jgi:cytochrome c553